MNKLFVFLFFFLVTPAFAGWNGKWDTKGSDVIIGLSSNPNNPNTAKNAFLVIGYTKNFGCRPVISVLILNGQSIGNPINQKTSQNKRDQLVITVNNQEFSGETRMTKYSNGIELAMMGNDNIINALSNSNAPFAARLGTNYLLDFSSATNFSNANNIAKANCS